MSLVAAQLDHLIVAAATLEEGVTWCENTLGVTPGPGGEHALFGTHNRLLKLDCDGAPNAYLEIIAINPQATPTRSPPLKRWFDLDDPSLQDHLRRNGPRLIHWVVNVPDIDGVLNAWRALGIDPGPALAASRDTPRGPLHWAITVRDDGQRVFDGCLPSLIQWGANHPATSLADSGIQLAHLEVHHPQAELLGQALKAAGLTAFKASEGTPGLQVDLQTPIGHTVCRSKRP